MNEVVRHDEGWNRLRGMVLDSVGAGSRRVYAAALNDFFAWWNAEGRPAFVRATVLAYRTCLEASDRSSATINLRMTVLRKLAQEAADNGVLDSGLAAGIARVKGAKQLGIRSGNWLTIGQAQALLNAPDVRTLKGKRDAAILAVLLGCALRRSECAALTVEHIQQRDGRWCIVDLRGKGGRVRTVPMPAWVKVAIDRWTGAAAIETGCLFRSINRGGRIWGSGITEKVVWQIMQEYGTGSGLPNIAPHDLRRTCAKLCRSAGGELEQIQLLLGHASVQTTERYLGTRQDLQNAPNDRIGLSLAS